MTNKEDSLFKYENVQWNIPALFRYEAVYGNIYKTMTDYNIRLPKASIYGSIGCAWAGEQMPFVYNELENITLSKILNYIHTINAYPVLNFSCIEITKESLQDKYCNRLLDLAIDFDSKFIVTSDLLRDYIKEKNPNAIVIASVIKPYYDINIKNKTKVFMPKDETEYYNKLLKEYDIVSVRPEYSKNHLSKNLSMIDDISRIEVTVDRPCLYNCSETMKHYKYFEDFRNIEPTEEELFPCIKDKIPFEEFTRENSTCIHSKGQIEEFIDAGVKYLKIHPQHSMSADSFLYLLYSNMFNVDNKYRTIYYDLLTNKLQDEINYFSDMIYETMQNA